MLCYSNASVNAFADPPNLIMPERSSTASFAHQVPASRPISTGFAMSSDINRAHNEPWWFQATGPKTMDVTAEITPFVIANFDFPVSRHATIVCVI